MDTEAPGLLGLADPIVVPPSENVTVVGAGWAVRVTACPKVEGLGLDERVKPLDCPKADAPVRHRSAKISRIRLLIGRLPERKSRV
jgi:hypothetical protein